ncbi:MAG: formate dehydrogenase accessory sulfurtransferase FdhD [Candidatus Dormibacter sp.]|uniref:formate dehydrogenase accessory sulfurtransferase FdhD n=1 Tax=Candidatus Dormibacter sp. TaxID=2973982 RepID=UPI000DB65D68|nr:MAG: formate dehydrogenase accessory sulfurtransferase FdhD [Candidatus Dormibacteraeota bacterium]
MREGEARAVTVRWTGQGWQERADLVAVEEPLELLLEGSPLTLLMRTPGNDVELALGLLWAERLVTAREQVSSVRLSAETGDRSGFGDPVLLESNRVDVSLLGAAGRRPERSFLSSSACGVCGATSLADLAQDFPVIDSDLCLNPAALLRMGEELRGGQPSFQRTGGLHAAALFDGAGRMLMAREDIGRHNAVDKVVGRALLDGRLPCADSVLVVSGRGGYEIVQKAVAAGIPIVAAVGAPSSLAVAVADRFRLTLVGFLRDGRFNVYSAPERLEPD